MKRIVPFVLLVLVMMTWTSLDASAFQEEPPVPQEGKEKSPEAASTPVPPEVSDLLDRVYHPVRSGLEDMTFEFRHQAFENAAYPYRGVRFDVSFKAPDKWKLEVRGLHEAHELMGPRLVELMSWIRKFTAGVEMLDDGLVAERIVSVAPEGKTLKVIARPGENEIPLTLRFREQDGKLYLHGVQSQKYGTLRLVWEKVDGVEVVTALEINDPRTALGPWTLRCEEQKINQGLDDSRFKGK